MFRLAMAMLIANLQAVAEVPPISVAVKDDAGVPREWLRQANFTGACTYLVPHKLKKRTPR